MSRVLIPALAAALLGGAARAEAASLSLPHAATGAAPDASVDAARPTSPDGRRQDVADSLYRDARRLFGRGEYRAAAERFRTLAERYPRSSYANDAVYYQAYALYRLGGSSDLRRARDVLIPLTAETVEGRPTLSVALRRDARELDTRICGELARRGDEPCARAVRRRADVDLDLGDVGAMVRGTVEATVAATREAMASAEVRQALRETQAAAAEAAREGTRAAAEALRSPELRRAIDQAAQEAARASGEAARITAEALRGAAASLGDSVAWRRSTTTTTNFYDDSTRPFAPRRDPGCRDEDDDERLMALNAVQQMDPERALPLLRKVLDRRDRCSEALRRRAVFLVARTRSPESAALLMRTARGDPDAEVREQSVYWLSRVEGPAGLAFLANIVRTDTSVSLRKRAVFALAQRDEPSARATLREMAAAKDVPIEVRGDAIQWLSLRPKDGDVEFLRGLFPTLESRELKERVVNAVARQKDGPAWLLDVARDARQPMDVRKSAMTSAALRSNAAQLVALYDDVKERELRESVLLALSGRREPAAVDKLIAIARADADRELRKSAIYWLSRSKDPKALAFLQEVIER